MICFGIYHLDYDSLTNVHFGTRRAVAISQQQLNGAHLLVNVHLDVFPQAGSNTAELLNEFVSRHLTAGQLRDRDSALRPTLTIAGLPFCPSRHKLSSIGLILSGTASFLGTPLS
jgi:hypothetical protein